MSDYAYETREAAEFHRQMTAPDKLPLSERKENAVSYLDAMRSGGRDGHDNLAAERIGWLLNGSYGNGAMQAARRVVRASGRTNKTAQPGVMVAAVEWQCPSRLAVAAWKKLTADEKAKLEAAIKAEIKSHLEEE